MKRGLAGWTDGAFTRVSGPLHRPGTSFRQVSSPTPGAAVTLIWIVLSGVAMSAIALVGGLTLFWRRERLRLTMVPLVASRPAR